MGSGMLRKLMAAGAGVAALFTISAGTAAAQERPAPAVEFTAGSLLFPDDGIVNEPFAAVAARYYLSPRIAVGPEISYVRGTHHSHVIATGNLTCDLLAPAGGTPRRVTPFVVVGGGWFQTRERFVSRNYNSAEGAFTAGGGVRVLMGDRVTVGIDSRIGWELHIRVDGVVGIRLGR